MTYSIKKERVDNEKMQSQYDKLNQTKDVFGQLDSEIVITRLKDCEVQFDRL